LSVTFVESAALTALAYDESTGRLRVEFRSRAIYDYFGVPVEIYGALLCAPSVGAGFNKLVRGCFPYCRVAVDSERRLEGER
jgi:KTSC domain